jgi:FdhD protein
MERDMLTTKRPRERPTIMPNPSDPRLTQGVEGIDQTGARVAVSVPVERSLTLYLNSQEIVTMMTICDYPEYLAIGYLLNQNMLKPDDVVTAVDYDDDLEVVVVRTKRGTNYEEKLKKRTLTSGCAQGTAFGDLMEVIEGIELPAAELRTSWLFEVVNAIKTIPSIYREAGSIHGCVLCKQGRPLCYMEDVGRHNAIDKIAGWMYRNGVSAADKMLYTTGRLTSEMTIKTVRMGIPILISRSGSTGWGVELARKAALTMISRARGRRFVALSGIERLVFDDLESAATSGELRENAHDGR